MSKEDFDQVIDINLLGVFLGMKHAIPVAEARGGGAIINIGSDAGMMAYANISAYVASKWAVRGITKSAAMELGATASGSCRSTRVGSARPMTEGHARRADGATQADRSLR
jgi:3alpha(or 20beta)-hydroxysteroid dehydrogenase